MSPPGNTWRAAAARQGSALSLAATLMAVALLASGCASRSIQGGSTTPSSRAAQLSDAATSPLSDFNLSQVEIPPILKAARAQPYATPAGLPCAPMLAEVLDLDAALGPDVDATAPGADKSLADASTEAVGDAAVGAFRSTVENLVPFRGWVRRLSGANQYEREVAAALAAGMARRAYLKGLMQAHGCLKMGEKASGARLAPGTPLTPPAPAPTAIVTPVHQTPPAPAVPPTGGGYIPPLPTR